MLGQRCKPMEAKNTYGTGCFLLLHTGTEAVASQAGLLTTMVGSCPCSIHAQPSRSLTPTASYEISCPCCNLCTCTHQAMRCSHVCRVFYWRMPQLCQTEAGKPML